VSVKALLKDSKPAATGDKVPDAAPIPIAQAVQPLLLVQEPAARPATAVEALNQTGKKREHDTSAKEAAAHDDEAALLNKAAKVAAD